MTKKRVLVTGGTGFVGKRLCATLLKRGYAVSLLTRRAGAAIQKLPSEYSYFSWDGSGAVPPEAVEGSFGVIHLAGEPVAAKRWSEKTKAKIYESRVNGTRAVAEAIEQAQSPPTYFLGASGVGFYGDRADEVLTENSARGTGFLPDVCRDWEAAYGPRCTAILRLGMVLGAEGGALQKMLPAFHVGAGAVLGDGTQWVSWIHIDDLVDLFVFLLEGHGSGTFNATGPAPVTNRDFTKALAECLGRPSLFSLPAPLLRLALGEMATVLVGSQRALPEAALKSGFAFRYKTLEAALNEALPS
jgi:uncharacterized protein (TIGR01777 family)